jgi:hypothetical protein
MLNTLLGSFVSKRQLTRFHIRPRKQLPGDWPCVVFVSCYIYTDVCVGLRLMCTVVCFLLGNSPVSEFYMPMFQNTLFHLHRKIGMNFIPTCLWRWNRQSVPKLRHIKFRCWEITQKKAYNIQNTAKVWNKEYVLLAGSNSSVSTMCMPEVRQLEDHSLIPAISSYFYFPQNIN